jgi:hypothetical protein
MRTADYYMSNTLHVKIIDQLVFMHGTSRDLARDPAPPDIPTYISDPTSPSEVLPGFRQMLSTHIIILALSASEEFETRLLNVHMAI